MKRFFLCFSAFPKYSLKQLNELQFFLKRIDVHIYMTFMQNIQNRFVAEPQNWDVKFSLKLNIGKWRHFSFA